MKDFSKEKTMLSFSHTMLSTLFPEKIPNWFAENLNFAIIDAHLTQFKLVAVLPWGRPLPVRVTWSDKGEEDRWINVMQSWLPKEERHFLEEAPTRCRKVFDTDGFSGEIVLDDLYEVDGWAAQHMCSIYSISQKQYFYIHKIDSPLSCRMVQRVLFHPAFMACLACGGMWGARSNAHGEEQSILWVSEAKWQKNIPQTQNLIESHNPPDLWWKLKALGREHKLQIYPDAIEFFADGRIDLSVMFEP